MIRLSDALILARTKLRTHKVRTGITIGVAGILFGLLFGGVFIVEGIFSSVERFNQEGLADRSIVTITKHNSAYFDVHLEARESSFVAEVKKAHQDLVANKTAAAKKYGITYDSKTEDPSPIEIDTDSGQEKVSERAFGSDVVLEVVRKREAALFEPLAIDDFLDSYHSATVLEGNATVQPEEGQLLRIVDGKEKALTDQERFRSQMGNNEDMPTIQVLNDSVVSPFIIDDAVELKEGELPGVVSFTYAEKLLGLEKLAKSSTDEEKMARLQEVRERVSEITASFCYRNSVSSGQLAQATAQRDEIDRNKNNQSYTKPSVMYGLPDDGSCGAVTVASDTRNEFEKRAEANLEAYQKEIGAHPGEPVQHKITLRAIGLSGDALGLEMAGGAAGDLVTSLLGSWLSYGANWSIPAGMLAEAPEELRPEYLFKSVSSRNSGVSSDYFNTDVYMVEFTDKNEARKILQQYGFNGDIITVPFGSGTLIVDQIKSWFSVGIFWALIVVGGVALIILASLIGRMVSDGRRESAVFRAIGAKRIDIGSIYGMYALLLSLRVAFFSFILGLAVAIIVELWLSKDATISARLAYAAVDTDKSFHFIGIGSWYIPAMVGTIILTGLLASIIPIFLGSRRSPINDMRDDT